MKKYKLSTGGIIEIIGSVLILLSSILPWVALRGMTGLGDLKSAYVSPLNLLIEMKGILALAVLGLLVLCAVNIRIKFSRRLRWISLLSVILTVFLYLQIIHTDIDGAVFGTVGGELAFGVFVAFIGVILLIVGTCIPSHFTDQSEPEVAQQELTEHTTVGTSDIHKVSPYSVQPCEETDDKVGNVEKQAFATVNEDTPRWHKIIYVMVGLAVIGVVSYFLFFKDYDNVESSPSVEDVTNDNAANTTAGQYILFEDNGKTGVKDGSGKVIIPAEYTTGSFDIDDNHITAIEAESGHNMCYFKKTGQLLSHINASYGNASGVTLYHFADTDTHAFYTEEGEVKARGLSGDIFCLRQINPQTGYAIRTYYGFRNKDNNDDFMPVYNEEGNRVCTFTVNGWQLFGIDHLERNEDEPRDFEKEFTFTIELDDFIIYSIKIIIFAFVNNIKEVE